MLYLIFKKSRFLFDYFQKCEGNHFIEFITEKLQG